MEIKEKAIEKGARLAGKRAAGAFMLLLAFAGASGLPDAAWAHGERTHQPSLRMRSIQWYDVQWSSQASQEALKVNDTITITGKMYFAGERYWPETIGAPDPSYLQTSGPASVFVKREAYINEVAMPRSSTLELGRTYSFKLVMQARVPGRWHVHPALLVKGTGPIVGPGHYFDVQGAWSAFSWPATATIAGGDQIQIDNLETWRLGNILGWHIFWIVVALAWAVWWLRRPALIPRYRAVKEGHQSLLIGRTDVIAGIVLLIGTLAVVVGSYIWTESRYPGAIPLQTGVTPVEPLPEQSSPVTTEVIGARFDVPARALRMTVRISNTGDRPVWISEFSTAGVRFTVPVEDLPAMPRRELQRTFAGFPAEYLRHSLAVDPGTSADGIAPGETREVDVEVADALWEVEGLAAIVNSPVRRFGGLLWLYTDAGDRLRQHVDFAVTPTYGGDA